MFSRTKVAQEIEDLRLRKKEVADAVSIRQSKLSQILNGRDKPTPELARRFTFLFQLVRTAQAKNRGGFVFTSKNIRWLRKQIAAMERSVIPPLKAAMVAAEERAAEMGRAAAGEEARV